MNLGFVILFRVSVFITALVSATTSHRICRIGAVTRNVPCNSSNSSETATHEGLQGRIPQKNKVIVRKLISLIFSRYVGD